MKNTPDSWFGRADNKDISETTEPQQISLHRLWRAFITARVSTDWVQKTVSTERTHVATNARHVCVFFDPERLRRLMVNLLDNDLCYASQYSRAIQVTTQLSASGQVRLFIWSDGKPLVKTVRMHSFESFFTSESRSSGLGLYLSRKLCALYAALIGYQRTSQVNLKGSEGNAFFVIFKLATNPLHTALPRADGWFA